VSEIELPDPGELEERRDKTFSRRVALLTAIYAIVLAFASLGGANALEDIVLNQQQSSDQWAFYQAKVIREHQYRAQKLILEAQASDAGAARARLEALAAKFGEEEKRYNSEKKDIEKDAKKHERERDISKDRDTYFDYAEVFLQIAIVSSSVSILAASRPMLVFSLVLALLGAASTINGYFLLFRPGLPH
jgi:hypothetical protein